MAIGILAGCSKAKGPEDGHDPASAPVTEVRGRQGGGSAAARLTGSAAPPSSASLDGTSGAVATGGDAGAGSSNSVPGSAGAPPDAGQSSITLRIDPPRTGKGIAKRCAIAGDPIGGSCRSGEGGLAIDAKGVVYVADGERVLRYRRAEDGDGCRYEPAGAPIELPEPPVRKQNSEGPMYLRSGGPQWRLSRAGDAIYAGDFLAGLYRVDRGRVEPACVDVFGYEVVARVGGKLLAGRDGIVALSVGKRCTASPVSIDPEVRGEVYGIADKLYVVPRGRSQVVRYDGATKVPVAQDVRVCSVRALAACGDDACILDQNCMQIVQVGPDGAGRVLDGDDLFDRRPWNLGAAAPLRGGGLLVLAQHRDSTASTEVCEAALYELPPALFER